MKTMTINQAIVKIMKESGHPLTAKDIFERISENKYYLFKSTSPISVVTNEIRRHIEGNRVSIGRKIQFKKTNDGKYELVSS